MSIIEFEIKPSEYYEAGYFDGDYVGGQNFSVATLTCDFDRILGFEFQAGFYFEEGFIEEGAFGINSIIAILEVEALVVQVAEVSLGGYYQEGYFTPGYSEQRGSFFTLTAELERFGEIVEAIGDWQSSSMVNTVAVKIVDIAVDAVAEFTQAATISHIQGADLFAFGEASLALEVALIRDNNIAASSVFDIATDGRVFRDISAIADAAFIQASTPERSRDFDLNAMAAFSFDSTASVITSNEISVIVDTAVSVIISHIQGADLVAFGEATLLLQGTLTRNNNVDAVSLFDIDIDYIRLRDTASDATAEFIQSTIVLRNRDFDSNFEAAVSVAALGGKLLKLVSPTPDRTPKTVTRVGDTFLDTAQSRFGGASARFDSSGDALLLDPSQDFAFGTDDFSIELWYRPQSTSSPQRVLIENRQTATNDSNGWVLYHNTRTNRIVVQRGFTVILTNTTTISSNTWYHITYSRVNGVVRLFINGSQQAINSTSAASSPFTSPVFSIGQAVSGSTFVSPQGWIDDVRARKGVGVSSNFTAPAQQLTSIPGTVLLLNNNIETDNISFFDTVIFETKPENFAAQAAVTADLNFILNADIDATAEFVQVTAAERSRDVNSSLEAAASIDVAQDRIRLTASDQTAETSLFAVISNILGTDIVAENFANLDCSPAVKRQGGAELESQSTVNIVGGKIQEVVLDYNSKFSVFVSRNIGNAGSRPLNLSLLTSPLVFDTNTVFGGAAISSHVGRSSPGPVSDRNSNIVPSRDQDFYLEFWVKPNNSNGGVIISTGKFLDIRHLSNRRLIIRFRSPDPTQSPTFFYQYEGPTNTLTLNQWHHISIVKTSFTMSYYINGIRVITFIAPNNLRRIPFLITGLDSTGQVVGNGWWGSGGSGYTEAEQFFNINASRNHSIDELFFSRNTTVGYDPTASTILVPTEPRVNGPNVQFLYHFDNNLLDDVSLVQTTNANLVASSTVSSGLTGLTNSTSNLNSIFSINALTGVDRGADLEAFAEGTLAADGTVFRGFDIDLDSAFAQTSNVEAIRGSDVDLDSDFQQAANVNVVASAEVITSSIATKLAIVAKIGDVLIASDVVSAQETQAEKITDSVVDIVAITAFNAVVDAVRDADLVIAADTALTVESSRIVERTVSFDIVATADIDVIKAVGIVADLDSEFISIIDASGGTIRGESHVESTTTLDILETRVRFNSGDFAVLSQVTATAVKVSNNEITSESNFALDIAYIRERDVNIATDSVASKVVVAVKNITQDIEGSAEFAADITAEKITDSQIPMQSIADATANAEAILSAAAELNDTFVLDTTGFTNIDGRAEISAAFVQTAQGEVTAVISMQAFSDAALNADISVTRTTGAALASVAEQITEAQRIVHLDSDLIATASLDVLAGTLLDSGAITFDSVASKLVVGRLVNLDMKVYVIPAETRLHKIDIETRRHRVGEETRIFAIRRTQ